MKLLPHPPCRSRPPPPPCCAGGPPAASSAAVCRFPRNFALTALLEKMLKLAIDGKKSVFLIWIRMDLHHFPKPNPNPHQSEKQDPDLFQESTAGSRSASISKFRSYMKAQNRAMECRGCSQWSRGGPNKAWRVCRPVVADSHHEEQNPDPDLALNPHQSEKSDPDPH